MRFAALLGMSSKQLDTLYLKFFKDHGEQAGAELEVYLRKLYSECRDETVLLGRYMGVIRTDAAGFPARQRTIQTWDANGPEPEVIPEDVVDGYAKENRKRFEVLKAETIARKETRSRLERLRQAEIQLRKQNKPVDHHIQQIEKAIDAMNRDAQTG